LYRTRLLKEDDRVKLLRWILVAVVVGIIPYPAMCSDRKVVLELTAASLSATTPDSASWGWWEPSKYDAWQMGDDQGLRFADGRVLVSGTTYTVFLAAEFLPTVVATGSYDDGQGQTVVDDLTLKIETYDLALGQFFGSSPRTGVMPWIGVSYVRLEETLAVVGGTSSQDDATSSLWGLVAGADGTVAIWSRLDFSGRVVLRWASGTRTAFVSTEGSGSFEGGSVEQSDETDRTMWGVDLGLRWRATRVFEIEGGWRYRDWTLDGGPAKYSGPYVKVLFVF
jgi:hypothetical protein